MCGDTKAEDDGQREQCPDKVPGPLRDSDVDDDCVVEYESDEGADREAEDKLQEPLGAPGTGDDIVQEATIALTSQAIEEVLLL